MKRVELPVRPQGLSGKGPPLHDPSIIIPIRAAAIPEDSDPFTAFRRATRALTHLYDLVLAPTGLKATQFAILRGIAQHEEIAQWRLAREFDLAVETLTRRLAKLRRNGLVSMRVGSGPKRERLYRLTPAGARKINEVEPYWNRAEQRLRAQLTSSEWDTALRLAQQLAAASQQAESAKLANTVVLNVRQPAPGAEQPSSSGSSAELLRHPAAAPSPDGRRGPAGEA